MLARTRAHTLFLTLGPTLSPRRGNYGPCRTAIGQSVPHRGPAANGWFPGRGPAPFPPPPLPGAGGSGRGNASRGAGLAATPRLGPRPPALGRKSACAPRSGRRLRPVAARGARAESSSWAGGRRARAAPPLLAPPLPSPPPAGPARAATSEATGKASEAAAQPAVGTHPLRADRSLARRPLPAPRGPTPALRAAALGSGRACARKSRATVPSGDRDRPRPGRPEPRGARQSSTDPRPRCRTS